MLFVMLTVNSAAVHLNISNIVYQQGKILLSFLKSSTDEVFKEIFCSQVVAHDFNSSTQEAEAGGSLSSRPAWFIE